MTKQTPHLKKSLTELMTQAEELVSQRKRSEEIYSFSIGLPETGLQLCAHNEKLYSASVMKIFVMAAIMDQYEQIIQKYDQARIDDALEGMITASSNTDWALLVMVLGDGDYHRGVQALKDWNMENGYRDTEMVLEPYGNYTSVHDAGRVLMDIDQNRLKGTDKMKELLERQAIPGRIRAGLPKGVPVGNKPGWIDGHDNDAAMIYSPKGTYVLSVMAANLHDTCAIQNLTKDLSSLVYQWMQENMEDFTVDPRVQRGAIAQDYQLILKVLKSNTSTLLEAFKTLQENWDSLVKSSAIGD